MTDQTAYQAWLEKSKVRYPLTEQEVEAMFEWSTRHGSANGWTGASGSGASYIRRLLLERKLLMRLIDEFGLDKPINYEFGQRIVDDP